ncbi:MAG: GlsB/YeaQ/YmgE family stress response membrane protein, partial [Planctomycetales bacterium]|nr:GlsB/YeaQ/YmgE family stress response membrane protein [Planctomycetales bacterium]
MLHLIGFVLFGLIVGAIARLLLPGRQSMGWIMTIVLGMVGSVVGGFLGSLLFQGAGVWQPG